MTKFGTGPGWKRVQRPLATALLCGAMLTSLTGCIELMVGGAVMGGVAAADRRTLGAQTEDKSIALKGESRIPSIVGARSGPGMQLKSEPPSPPQPGQ